MALRVCLSAGIAGLAAACLTGCATGKSGTPAPEPHDARQAQAFARYMEGLILTPDRSRTGEAQRAFAAAHQLDPDSRPPLDALLLRLLQDNRPKEALAQLEAFCRKHPQDADAHVDLAQLAELNRDFERAAAAYEQAARLRPGDLTLAGAQIRVLFAARRDAEALSSMRRLHREKPSLETRTLPAYWAMQFYRREKDGARALPCLELAGTFATGTAQRVELRLLQGEVSLAAGQTNLAIRSFRETLAQSPLHIRAASRLARVLYESGGAAALTNQAKNTPDTDLPGLLTLASLHLVARDRTNAVVALARARAALQAQQQVPSPDFYLLHGSTLDELGRREEAAAVFLEALRHHPRAHILMNYLAYLWAVANLRIEEAAHWAQQAVRLAPRNGAYLDTLGWVRFRQQRLEEAFNLLQRAHQWMPDDPTILDHLGDVLARLQRTSEAAAYWSRSYALDPAQPEVAAKLRSAGVNPESIPRITPRAPDTDTVDEEEEE